MSRAIDAVSFMTAWNKPADEWSRSKAAEMREAGYDDGVIIRYLEAYGIGLYSAQGLLHELDRGGK